ncbi:bifunctional [glutamate--ammonia ligase]-adenylyl-L-tyrosine phosphorylase/[glutamate--ammonia-ligase] adenylyltransferase [Pleionea sediminis]|uniref:bifunctional [glutamate--ammonia ligase]-adenylyl-L-tyrosine phosphorylase/[glutamate--ammonia-ligase] adenylyltransferase n=1 Tax=Pleionea sediminis TaxID=2569479 RepID=UPI0013DE7435|nr:bifunctional [glutamate--ammonia ligase]-adenylyl-L-tyrosine phosphorylase/[glutamate--ammonia-ligase] adenylyltransferase [Pleionea sediminis]
MSNSDLANIEFSTQVGNFLTPLAESAWEPIVKLHADAIDKLPGQVKTAFIKACALSPFVAECLLREFDYLSHWCLQNSLESQLDYKSIEELINEDLVGLTSDIPVKQVLRRWRTRLFGLIAIRRLNRLTTIEQELADISHLSDKLILAAYHWLYPQFCLQWGYPKNEAGIDMPLLIVAMGKFGGYELNFSSDIDLIFYYPEDGQSQGAQRSLELHTFYIRLGQRLINLLGEVTRDGYVFRVDMRLRPYGEDGPLAMSFAAAEDYYQEQGREWERFAMIKARVINADNPFADEFYQLIKPFVYRRYIDFGVLESIRNLKSKIETEIRRRGLADNIKLGSGGIREAEFIVQSLQLIRGGRVRNLQERSFIQALQQLVDLEMINEAIAGELLNAYLFLREVEHILQQINDQQTQQLPQSEVDQARLTAAMSFKSYAELLEQLKVHQSIVAREFSAVFHADEDEAVEIKQFSLDVIEKDDFQHWYKEHKTEQLELMVKKLREFVNASYFQQLSSKGKSRVEALLPKFLFSLATEELPAVTLERVLVLLRSIIRRTAYLVLLEENPPVLDHLIKLCGQSQWVSEQLAEHPLLLDELLYPASLYQPLMKADLKLELRQQLMRIEPEDEEQQQEQLRIFKQTHELRVAAAVLNKTIDVKNASRYLSQIANAILDSVLILAWKKLCKRYGVPSVEGASYDNLKGFSVIAYGKFGGEELGFGSDLDLVFLYDADPEGMTQSDKPQTNNQFFTRLAQRIIHSLNIRTMSGVLYEVDMRLRPSGSSGLLVSLIQAFQDYQINDAWTWEHQALTRARAVVGDRKIRDWFASFRLSIIEKERDKISIRKDVIKMRKKMRQALDKSTVGNLDFKQCSGGMVDIEFIVQYLLLINGCMNKGEPWSSRTTRQYDRLAELNIIEPTMATELIMAYRYYRELNNLLVLSGKPKLVKAESIENQRERVRYYWSQVFGNDES